MDVSVEEGSGEEQSTSSEVCAVCNAVAQHRCAGCNRVFYCKKECQKEDWKKGHKEMCKPVKMMQNSTLGRYLVATRNFKSGEVIFQEDPLIVGPKQFTLPVCLGCYKVVDGNYRCSKCMWPLCSPQCEAAFDHQPECVVGQEIGSIIDIQDFTTTNHFYEVVMPLRCLTLKKRSAKKYDQLLQLESHYEDRKDTELAKDNQLRVVNMLRNYFMMKDFLLEEVDTREKAIHTITGIIDINSVDMRIGEGEMNGLFPTFAMMEHNCQPNTKHTFNEKRQVVLKASRDIKKGEHLSTMYTSVFWGTMARREFLKLNKFFMCVCKRCSDSTECGTNFSALRCPSCPLGYMYSVAALDELAAWACSVCDCTMPASEVDAITKQLGGDVEVALENPTVESLEAFIEEKTATTCHPNHFHLFLLKHTLLQMYGRDGNMNKKEMSKKEKLCQEFMKIVMALDPGMGLLGVYAAVALYEYHVALLTKDRSGSQDDQGVRKDIDTAKALLQRCITLLEDEPDTAGGGMRKVCEANLKELRGETAM